MDNDLQASEFYSKRIYHVKCGGGGGVGSVHGTVWAALMPKYMSASVYVPKCVRSNVVSIVILCIHKDSVRTDCCTICAKDLKFAQNLFEDELEAAEGFKRNTDFTSVYRDTIAIEIIYVEATRCFRLLEDYRITARLFAVLCLRLAKFEFF